MQYFEVKYETASHIPPPYCYFYHLKVYIEPGGLRVEFQWTYHQREGITPEELEEEGFTGQDDFAWKGQLDQAWLPEISKMITKSRLATKTDEEAAFLHITATGNGRIIFDGSPQQVTDWEYFLQELIQAIYETSGREAPLTLRYKKIESPESFLLYTLTLQFRNRQVLLARQSGTQQSGKKVLPWDQTQEVLQSIYLLDYRPDETSQQEPAQPGNYLDIGEGVWYQLGKSANNPAPRKDYIKHIQRFFDEN